MASDGEYRLGKYWLARRGDSPNWYRCWLEGRTPKRVSLGCTTFEEAKARLEAWWAEQYRIAASDLPPSEVMLADVILDYWNGQGSKLRSAQTVSIMLRYWTEWWKDVTVAEVRNPNKQDDFRAHLSTVKKLNPTSVARCLEIGRAAIRRAWKRGVISSFPHVEVPLVRETEPKGRPLTVEEIGQLLGGTDEPHMQLVVFLLLGTAARSEPILKLDWGQILWADDLIKLNPDGRVQTSKRRPAVKLPSTLRAVLEPLKGDGRVIMFRKKKVDKIDHGFRRMVERSELKGHVTPYSLRHTVARWLRMKSVPMEQIAGQLGHSMPSFAMSERYAPHDPSYLKEACAAIDELLALVLPSATKLVPLAKAEPQLASRLPETDAS